MPSTNAAETSPHLTPARLLPPAGSCANADTAKSIVVAASMMTFLFTPFSSFGGNLKSMFFRGDRAADVNHGQHDEDERLQKCTEDSKAHNGPRNDKRQHSHENPGGGVLAEDVPEETHAQREHAGEVADDLDRKHQRRQPPDRTGEVLEVVKDALPADALKVEIQKRRDRQRKGRVRIA